MKETKKERFIRAWKTVFDLDEVKDDDNFFEVGGDSMKGVQLISALAGYGLKLDMLKLYTQPTVEELVEAAEEMEPVEIPAEMISGSLTGEEMEKYLKDPAIQKAMSEFGIRAEDIMERAGTGAKKAEAEEPKAAPEAGGVPPFTGGQPGAVPPFAGMQPGAVPPFAGMQPGGIPPFMTAQPGAVPMQAGYLIPVPMMYYFVPVSGPEGMGAQPSDAAPFPGAAAFPQIPFPGAASIPVMAYPVFLPWPYGTLNNPENRDSDKKE